MKEAHEVERILKQLLGMKIKAEEIQTLPLGHFFAVVGNQVKKVYVLPSGVPEEVGVEVATGAITPESIQAEYLKEIPERQREASPLFVSDALLARIENLEKEVASLE